MAGGRVGAFVVALAGLCTPAMAQWWWPPQMEVAPTCPHPSSSIVATLSGQWPDNCRPNAYDVVVNGNAIDIYTRREPPPGFCLQVITPWSLPVTIGQLPVGSYSVYGTHRNQGAPVTGRELLGTIQVSESCPGACYANCDGSTVPPVLNVGDFTCFLQRFAAGESYANCDSSTVPPVLNVGDFTCFLQRFAAGCQ
jgi:hypothetical protein